MTDPVPPSPSAVVQPEKKKGPSCWTVGCGGCLVLVLILVGIGVYINWQIQTKFLVEPFESMQLAESEMEKMDARLEEVEQLQSAAEASGENWIPAEGLTFSEQEVNYWLSQENPEFGDSVRIDFEPDEINAELRVGEPGGRRLKLSARVSVKEGPDGLDVRIVDLKLGNISLPEQFLKELSSENLAQDAIDDPEVQQQLKESVGGVEILKDAILVLPPKE